MSYFKHTVYGLRFLFRIYELGDKAIKLHSLKKKHTLPVVLSVAEVKRLLSSPKLLKHRVLIDLIYSSGLRLKEVLGWDHKYLGAQMGTIGILHTWGQNLSLHPHVHYIVPGGGVDIRGKWRAVKSKGKYLFPVKVMMIVFRARFVKLWKEWVAKQGMELTTETIETMNYLDASILGIT